MDADGAAEPTLEDARTLLAEIPFFAAVPPLARERLAGSARWRRVAEGDPVVRRAHTLVVVASGVIEVLLEHDELGVERPLALLDRGDVFGELGLLTGTPRSATLRAAEAACLLELDRMDLLDLLETEAELSLALARLLAHRLVATNQAQSWPVYRLPTTDIDPEAGALLPARVVRRYGIVPVGREGRTVTLATTNPADPLVRNVAETLLEGHRLRWLAVPADDLERLIDQRAPSGRALAPEPEEVGEVRYLQPGERPLEAASSEAALLLDALVARAIHQDATDIHFEPGPVDVAVRVRLDGRLHPAADPLPFDVFARVASRLRVLCGLDIAGHRQPQDGSVVVEYGGRRVDLRVSMLPATRGESVACRLLDPARRRTELDRLILARPVAELVESLFFRPSGLVLVTGPAGAGKTTTLYAGLQQRLRRTPHIKVVTCEDPIEYELDRCTQVQVNPTTGLTFERVLRSLLRQDPNVMLVGEMRDTPSVHIALEAAVTGHLVLSSLHTGEAMETIARLRQRGARPYAIAAGLEGVVSQRLVPRLCPTCAEPADEPPEVLRRLRAAGLIPADGDPPGLMRAPGCPACHSLGRRGRIGVFEVVVVTAPLREAIERQHSRQGLEAALAPGTHLPLRRYASFLLARGAVAAEDLLPLFPMPGGEKGVPEGDLDLESEP